MSPNKGKDKDNKGTSQRGFASMNEEKQREIASKGGRAAHEKGTAHELPQRKHAKRSVQLMKKVRFMSLLLKRRTKQAGKEVMLPMKKVQLMNLARKKRVRQAAKVGIHVVKATPRMKVNHLSPLVMAHLSSMRKQVGKAIKIANQQ